MLSDKLRGISSESLKSIVIFGGTVLEAYKFSEFGFGNKMGGPATPLPFGNSAYDIDMHPSNSAIAMSTYTSPYIAAYQWSADGFGSRYADPTTLPSGGTGYSYAIKFSRSGNSVVVGHANSSSYVSAYPWSPAGFGARFANPSVIVDGEVRSIAFNPAGNVLLLGHYGTSSRISAYQYTDTAFGTKYAAPSVIPTGSGRGVDFHPSGNAVAIVHTNIPFISVYQWSESGFGTKFANPTTLPGSISTDSANSVAFHPAGNAIAVAQSRSPFISVYQWSESGFGTKFANPTTLPPSAPDKVKFNKTGTVLIGTGTTSPQAFAYQWTPTGFGFKFSDPATPLTGTSLSLTLYEPD